MSVNSISVRNLDEKSVLNISNTLYIWFSDLFLYDIKDNVDNLFNMCTFIKRFVNTKYLGMSFWNLRTRVGWKVS